MTVVHRLATALADRYRIERELGAGGMATVYLAEDLKHKRKVALKVLKPELAAVLGAERFVQEITTTASLQHPNILPLFDSGTADGFLYYVMPFIEGETLRDRLNRDTQLGVDEAVKLVVEVADALQYAHEHNVIHRDIKPENILLANGRPLVADFGIALAVSAAAGGRMTETGLSLGTPHYMSPEQATAEKTITARSDIYSLASVLYEMLAGQPPHLGGSAQQIIMKIIAEPVQPVTALRRAVPPNVAAAVGQALEKLPADRFESARAFADALGNKAFTTSAMGSAAALARRDWRQRLALPMAVSIVALLLASVWLLLRPAPAALVTRQHIVLGNDPSAGVGQRAVAIAPDGSSIVYEDSVNGTWGLVRKLRDRLESTPLPGGDSGGAPFFSPTGGEVAFVTFADQGFRLLKMPIDGGPPFTIAEGLGFFAAAWLDDGTILYLNGSRDLMRVSDRGGSGQVVRRMNNLVPQMMFPLPGSHGVLLSLCAGNCVNSSVFVLDLRSDSLRLLFEGAQGAWYAPTGHVLYTDNRGGLFAAAFDAATLELRGSPVPLASAVPALGFALSSSGTAFYDVIEGGVETELVWVARDGSAQSVDSLWRGDFQFPAISPDGRSVAVSMTRDGRTDIWVKQFGTGRQQRLTSEGQLNWRPAWNRDGSMIAFVSDQLRPGSGKWDAFVRRADGSTPAQPLYRHELSTTEVDYSPDGQWLLLGMPDTTARVGIRARKLEGDTALKPLLVSRVHQRSFALSPDRRWLAFTSEESGQVEVFVVSFPDATTRQVVSSGGGIEPRWAHSSRELFFKSNGMLMSAAVQPGTPITFAAPRPLFSVLGYASAIQRQMYDVAPDDRRFLMIKASGRAGRRQVVYVENFFEELKRKVPR